MESKDSFINNSLSHRIAERITQQIVSGDLKPGEKIIESEYAREFGTSRAPIRESLYLLATEGLIERIPRKGAIVKGYSETEIYDIFEIRMGLESLAMKRIKTIGVNKKILEEIEELILKMTKVEDDHEQYAILNQEFHRCIIEMSGSEIIKDMYLRLGRPLLALQRLSFLEGEYIRKSIEEHQLIIKLLTGNLVEESISVLQKHNSAVINRIL